MPATNPSELLQPCYTCLGMSMADSLLLGLWGSISENVEVIMMQVSHGSGPPVAAPSSPGLAAIYYDDDEVSPSYGVMWPWDVSLQVWIGA